MERALLHITTLTTLFFSQFSFAQLSKHNVSASAGFIYPYSHESYNSISINGDIEYLLMLNPSNGIGIEIDFVRFRNKEKLLSAEINTISAGFRHQFTKAYYAQASLGVSSTIYIDPEEQVMGTVELRTGFYFPFQDKLGFDLSLFLKQTTKEFGWVGIRIASILSLRKKKK